MHAMTAKTAAEMHSHNFGEDNFVVPITVACMLGMLWQCSRDMTLCRGRGSSKMSSLGCCEHEI